MSKSVRVFALPAIFLATLSACGGGGGGGSVINQAPGAGPASGAPVPFTSFSSVRPNTTSVMDGISQTGSGTDAAFNLDEIDATSSGARVSYDAAGNVSGFTFTAPGSGITLGSDRVFPVTNQQTGERVAFSGSTQPSPDADIDGFATIVDPLSRGWNYQSFGVWMKDPFSASFQAGAISAGAVTPGSAVPTIGSATFNGHAGGFYFDGAGNRFSTDAQMSAVTNFQNRTINFSTSGTLLSTLEHTPVRTSRPELNLNGNLSYAPGTSQFSGDVNTADNALSGSASGRFYGPNAQEIGGVYGLSAPSGGARMIGAFGGKR